MYNPYLMNERHCFDKAGAGAHQKETNGKAGKTLFLRIV